MKVIVINCGSSSIKLSLFENEKEPRRLAEAHLKDIYSNHPILEMGSEKKAIEGPTTITKGLELIFSILEPQLTNLNRIGHRVVHGGGFYNSSVIIDEKVIENLHKISELAPLHNEASLEGIKFCLKFGSKITQIAVFDTSFHHSLPIETMQYALPQTLTSKYQIRRYGFHGIANHFLWNTYKKIDDENAKIITLHLGQGCSISAINAGKSIDTSMGFTPCEGLIMGTRVGDIDPGIMEYLCIQEKKTPTEILNIYNSKSGLLGISNIASNMKELMSLYDKDNYAKLAVDMFCYRIIKYIGSYIFILGGNIRALIFSGGIGENSVEIRKQILDKMKWFGIKMDEESNHKATNLPLGTYKKISDKISSINVYVIAVDENLSIAKDIIDNF